MTKISIYTLTSALHDEQTIETATHEFLTSIQIDYTLRGADFSDYGTNLLSLIYVRTGGTEGIFKQLLPQLLKQSSQPIYLLTSGKSNSLAASMEILSYLQQQGVAGEILHGSASYIRARIVTLLQVSQALSRLQGQRLGVIGQPSDWLISSQANSEAIEAKLGVKLVDVDIKEVLELFNDNKFKNNTLSIHPSKIATPSVTSALPDAKRLYHVLRHLVDIHQLSAFTIRCFDLLTAVHNTGCLALAQLNADGIVAGCEGDVPTALSMLLSQALFGITGFQANPSEINPETGMITLAHCTIPFNMVTGYELDTHFESGIGVGIRGFMREGPVTIFKVSGDLARHFVAQGELVGNLCNRDLCRTQLHINLDSASNKQHAIRYFLTHPIGNHHVVIPGHHAQLLEQLLASL